MPSIDESITRIDDVICRHLDNLDDSTRGAISQDILEQLTKFVDHIMFKFYSNGRDMSYDADNLAKALEYAQVNSELYTLYKFHNFLDTVITQYTLDENGSERLMLKYYQYLLEAKHLLWNYYRVRILHNLHKFPLHLDDTLQEYYTKIAEKIDQHPVYQFPVEQNRYYIQKIKPLFVNGHIYREITFAPVNDRKNKAKTNRVIAFTKLPIRSNYASKFHLLQESIEILGQRMPIMIIDSWEISIRDCEFKNFAGIIKGKPTQAPYPEQRIICEYMTRSGYSLNEIMDFPDYAYEKLTSDWKSNLRSYNFIPVLDRCREIIQGKKAGQNILRYLLYNMNNLIIKEQYSDGFYSKYYEEYRYVGNSSLSYLYLSSKCRPFDTMPFNQSPHGHNPRQSVLFECIPSRDKKPELFARFIKNNTEGKGQLFTDVNDIIGYQDIDGLIRKYNNKLWEGHRPRADLILEHDQVFLNQYKIDTCEIIARLQELSSSGIDNYSDDFDTWYMLGDYEIDCDEKLQILGNIFSESKVAVVYGSAGVGKSTLINHISHFLNDEPKLYLTQTNPAKENLIRKVDAENTTFSTIESFKHNGSPFTKYELLVIDECSTVSNEDMVSILNQANFNRLLLVGDTYQIDAIQFGNWFSVLKSFLPASAVFELTRPHRTKDKHLLELWDKVRHMDDNAKEFIEKESYSLKVDDTLLSPLKAGEAILCLNYDGLYGINNINRFLQESNPNPAYKWDVQYYKVGDPILFLDSDRFRPIIYNNMKGIIRGIEIIDKGLISECIQFDIEISKQLDEFDAESCGLELIKSCKDKSVIRFSVNKTENDDDDRDEQNSTTIVPFQVAYAVSIHKAQGLEYDSVKIVITDEVEELVTHNIFYTAITRAREKLKIYWTPEVEEKVLNRIKPRDISKDVELLKNYLTDKQLDESLDFLL